MRIELQDDTGQPFTDEHIRGKPLTILSTYRGRW